MHPNPEPDKRIFYSPEISRVILERCVKARDAIAQAVKIIAENSYCGTGETLLVGNPQEAWVMV